jgi:hypothetical protein
LALVVPLKVLLEVQGLEMLVEIQLLHQEPKALPQLLVAAAQGHYKHQAQDLVVVALVELQQTAL